MKVSLLMTLSVVLGLVLGVGTTWTEFGWPLSIDDLTDHARNIEHANLAFPAPGEPAPRVEIDDKEHNFGIVSVKSISKHSFHIRNAGDGPLQLYSAGTSCAACTMQRLSKSVLKPGETTDVTVEFRAVAEPGPFRQTATVRTNDPRQSQIGLVVEGTITAAFRADPHEITFTDISANAPASAVVKLYAFESDPLRIDAVQMLSPDSTPFLRAEIEPMPHEQVEKAEAKSGQLLKVTVKPGLPLGAIQQTIRLHTNVAGYAEVDIPVRGNVSSDISLSGTQQAKWHAEQGILDLGVIKGAEGARRRILVLVRGPHRHDAKITVGKCEPDLLRVTLGEPSDINRGAVVKIPMTIEIPRGSPPVNHLNSQQASRASITLETTLPDAPRMRFFVRFAVEGAN